MDSAYEGDETLRLARQLGYTPIVPPNPNRLKPWELDRIAYRRRNEIERLFRRLKSYRRVFCRFDKLDVLFTGFIVLRSLSKLYTLVLTDPRMVLLGEWRQQASKLRSAERIDSGISKLAFNPMT